MEGSEKKKKVRYMCVYITKWEESCIWLRPVKTNKHKAYCSLCKRVFHSHGGTDDCTQHTSTAGNESYLFNGSFVTPGFINLLSTSATKEAKLQLSKINSFFNNATMSYSKTLAEELSLVYHTVKHSVNKETANRLLCGCTKADAIDKNVLAPKSVKDLVDILSNEDDARKFFSLATDASYYKNHSYFDPCEGIQNKILDLIEQSDETQSVEQNGLDLRNVSYYYADNAFVNYGKHH
ncbi:hypothetical protein PR048_032900 [Dryococelus australis]|uniref:BED-type domain-containing protein n=1 Tax=Dryococelus australis TaxID=614101 RepID=A0ABQ9G3I7_9NEOP|nr:hypothetical protein PR048_032900 [Dryococelus australis]